MRFASLWPPCTTFTRLQILIRRVSSYSSHDTTTKINKMCLPVQLSHEAPHTFCYFAQTFKIGTCTSVSSFLPLRLSSHFLLSMEPSSLQPGVSAPLSLPSFLTGHKAAPPPGRVPALSGPCCHLPANKLPKGPLWSPMWSSASSISGRLSLDFCQRRAEVLVCKRINGLHDHMPSAGSMYTHIR